jgi:ribosomal protein L15
MKRLKKIRGFKAISPKKNVLKLSEIEKEFNDGDIISYATLVEKKIFRKSEIKNGVKILSTGTLVKKVTIAKDILVSDSAIEAIKKAGGKIEESKKEAKKEVKEK